jgi:hypothetical protein
MVKVHAYNLLGGEICFALRLRVYIFRAIKVLLKEISFTAVFRTKITVALNIILIISKVIQREEAFPEST